MTESERDEKFINRFKLNREKFDNKFEMIIEFAKGIEDGLKAYLNFNKEIDRISKKHLHAYYEKTVEEIINIKDLSEICKFLLAEKRKCALIVVEYNIRKEGLLGADYQTAIDKIIEPLLDLYKTELEYEKNLNSIKVDSNKPKFQNQNIIEIKFPSEPKIIVKPTTQKKKETQIEKSAIKLPEDFEQINCDGTKKEILDDLMLLAKSQNRLNNEYFMTENDVIEFANKNFSVFNSEATGKCFYINLLPNQKVILRYFIYQFIVKYNRKIKLPKIKYAKLLVHNFEQFKDEDPEILVTNISESKKPKSPLDIIQIPKRVNPRL